MKNTKKYIHTGILGSIALALVFVSPFGLVHADSEKENGNKNKNENSSVESRTKVGFGVSFCTSWPQGIVKRFSFCRNLPLDIIAPKITQVSIDRVNLKNTLISWSTDERTKGSIYYSTSSGFKITDTNVLSVSEKSKDDFRNPKSRHSLVVTKLASDTTYYFVVRAEDKAGNISISSEYSFVTPEISSQPPQDTIAPVIRDVVIRDVTESSAIVSWATDEPANSTVWYGEKSGLATDDLSHEKDQKFGINHAIKISDLKHATKYYIVLGGVDRSGNFSQVGQYSFTTMASGDVTAPIILESSVLSITENRSTIRIRTNEAVTMKLSYGVLGSTDIKNISFDNFNDTHTFLLANLKSSTEYQARVIVTDRSGNKVASEEIRWMTKLNNSDVSDPRIFNISVRTNLGEKSAEIGWMTDELSDSTVRYGTSAIFSSDIKEVANTTMTKTHELKILNLSVGQLYYFEVRSKDAAGNIGVSSTGRIFLNL